MLVFIALALEVVSVFICLYGMNGRKIRLNLRIVSFCLCNIAIISAINFFGLSGGWTVLSYIPFFVYCRLEFKEPVGKALFHTILTFIIVAGIQLLVMFLVGFLPLEDLGMKTFVCSALTFGFCIWILPWLKINELRKIDLRNNLIKASYGLVLAIFSILLLQAKLRNEVYVEFFMIIFPFIVMLLLLMRQWSVLHKRVEHMEKENDVAGHMQDKFEDLLTSIRIRQHGFKNHMTAIYSTHYTHKTYENLIKAQEKYCNTIIEENRYYQLLDLGDSVLTGFLYGKFLELEEGGIKVEYKIKTQIEKCTAPIHYIIEMLGILLDNAAEAMKDRADEKVVSISVEEYGDKYLFFVRNKSEPVSQERIGEWFQKGVSTKGADRGLGLYRVRCLCDEWDCSICCKNKKEGDCNWIEFILGVGKCRKQL